MAAVRVHPWRNLPPFPLSGSFRLQGGPLPYGGALFRVRHRPRCPKNPVQPCGTMYVWSTLQHSRLFMLSDRFAFVAFFALELPVTQ